MGCSCYDYLKNHLDCFSDFNAVTHLGHNTKYSKMIKDIDSLASYLQKNGISKGDVVTVFLPNIPHAFIAFYAINKIGAIANIVHPLTSPEGLSEILEHTNSKMIFVLDILTKKYTEVLNKRKEKVIICSNSDYTGGPYKIGVKMYELKRTRTFDKINNSVEYRKTLHYTNSKFFYRENDGENIAVYLHGGGTTGKSKTIMLSSDNINAIADHLELLDNGIRKPGAESSLVILPLFHAFGLAVAVHFPLSHGYNILPMPEFTPNKANKMLKKYNVSFLLGVPNMFKKMMDDSEFFGPHLAKLRLVFCGGDFLPERLVEDFNKAVSENGGKARLFRGYGLTEVSSVCCTNSYNGTKPNSVGRAIDKVTIEIWDDMKHKLPVGEDGEIVISGDTVMLGYYNGNNAVKNDGVYIDKNGKRWVLTGDLGHFDEEGFLYFTGRKKRMIIISGYNIYPADIENSVLQLPFISEVCAVQGYKRGRPCVKLCVTLSENIDKNKAEKLVLSHCKKNLNKFSCPRKIEFMDSFPRTKIGKVDFMKLSDKYEGD